MRTPIISVVVLAVALSGCASIIHGSSQSIAVTTVPEGGATCDLQSEAGNVRVVTPGTVTLEKSGQDVPIKCTKAGYQDTVAVLPSNFDAWTIGNILIPGALLWIGVDAATGAMNKYPKTLQVTMVPQTSPRPVASAQPMKPQQ